MSPEASASMPDIELVIVGRPPFDLADASSIRQAILAAKPEIVVSAAAYTAVDRAEDEQNIAYAINVVGAATAAEVAATLQVPVIHLSTNYVFSGDEPCPYHEETRPNRKPSMATPSCAANAPLPASSIKGSPKI